MYYYIVHSGVAARKGAPGRGSGRYPAGSGKRPFQWIKTGAQKAGTVIKKYGPRAGKMVGAIALGVATREATYAIGTAFLNSIPWGDLYIGKNNPSPIIVENILRKNPGPSMFQNNLTGEEFMTIKVESGKATGVSYYPKRYIR